MELNVYKVESQKFMLIIDKLFYWIRRLCNINC